MKSSVSRIQAGFLIGLSTLWAFGSAWGQESDQTRSVEGLQLRVAPRRPEMFLDRDPQPLISPEQRDAFIELLKREGRMAAPEQGDFRWFPLHGKMEDFQDLRLIIAKGPGEKGYILLSDEPSLMMVHSEDQEENWAVIEANRTQDLRGAPAVEFALNQRGGELLGQLTGENIERNLAIVLDGQVYSAPIIQSRLGERGVITGNFNAEEAGRIVRILEADMEQWPQEDRWGVWPWIIGAGAVVLLAALAAVVVTIRGRSRSAA